MAEKSEAAKLLPGQVRDVKLGDCAFEVWGGEQDGKPVVILAATQALGNGLWLKATIAPRDARVLSRALAEAAEDLEPSN